MAVYMGGGPSVVYASQALDPLMRSPLNRIKLYNECLVLGSGASVS
ncbi:MAG: hypothetical protein CM15mP62_33980 [Rhodospirillaceae bacterium]|nr:MAG: hypothetical protein CM15mP62_33980 [Rhodospirillaceae bacterium]